MGRQSNAAIAAQAAQEALKARAVALSGLAADQFDALSDDERAAFLAKAAAEIEAEAAEAAAAAAEREFAEKEAAAAKKAADDKAAADKAAAKEERAKKDAEAAAERKANEQAAAEADQGLINLVLNGEEIRVHPTCVEDHKRIGWKVK